MVVRLKKYIAIIEQQGLLPQTVFYHSLLEETASLLSQAGHKKLRCFISYAWNPDKSQNAALQAKLVNMKADLTKTGVQVMLDVHDMEGNINIYMEQNIQASDRVLLICTPRLVERAGVDPTKAENNLQKELKVALDKQRVGNFRSSEVLFVAREI